MSDKINGRTPEEIRKGQSFSEYLDEKLSKVNISSLEDEDQEQKKRTPEETKKGLSLCYADVCDCSECPYFNIEDCDKQLAADVLMLFQQLERERDAAVADMTELMQLAQFCRHCKHITSDGECTFDFAANKGEPWCWQWRGVQEVE